MALSLVQGAAESALPKVLGGNLVSCGSGSIVNWWSGNGSASHEGDNEDGGELGELHFDCLLGVLKLKCFKMKSWAG